MCLRLNKNIKEGNVTTPEIKKESEKQRNADIDVVLCALSCKQASIFENSETATMGDYFEYAACQTCKRVGKLMKADEGMLLPRNSLTTSTTALLHSKMYV